MKINSTSCEKILKIPRIGKKAFKKLTSCEKKTLKKSKYFKVPCYVKNPINNPSELYVLRKESTEKPRLIEKKNFTKSTSCAEFLENQIPVKKDCLKSSRPEKIVPAFWKKLFKKPRPLKKFLKNSDL